MLQVNCVIKWQLYKGIIGKFSCKSFVKVTGKKMGAATWPCYIQIHVTKGQLYSLSKCSQKFVLSGPILIQ